MYVTATYILNGFEERWKNIILVGIYCELRNKFYLPERVLSGAYISERVFFTIRFFFQTS